MREGERFRQVGGSPWTVRCMTQAGVGKSSVRVAVPDGDGMPGAWHSGAEANITRDGRCACGADLIRQASGVSHSVQLTAKGGGRGGCGAVRTASHKCGLADLRRRRRL